MESEKSFEGSEAEFYYEIKERREDYKRQKQQLRKQNEEELETQLEVEQAKEEQVVATYTSFNGACRRREKTEERTNPSDTLAGKDFDLFSTDHVRRFLTQCHNDRYRSKSVFFSTESDDCSDDADETASNTTDGKPLYAHVELGYDSRCEFGPFRHPKFARHNVVKIKSTDDEYDMRIKFFGKNYLNLSVSRSFVFQNDLADSADALEMFTFVGIFSDWEEKKRGRAEKQAEAARNAPPSPKESWFEVNHPMGSWAQSRW